MIRGIWILPAVAGLLLALCPSASAATLAVENTGKDTQVAYRAEPGEANRVKADSSAGLITVRDPGADITAGTGCVQVSAHEATCQRNAAFPTQTLFAELGNRDDKADALAGIAWNSLDGGSGDDELDGGSSIDRFDGGTGADRVDGAGSVDVVTYFGRTGDVNVTLNDSAANDGGKVDGKGGDRILDAEIAVGGSGDDHLVGTDGENTLSGQDGADVLESLGGEDDIFGGEGADVIRGGGGPDGLQPQAGADRTFGGAGPDILAFQPDESPDVLDGGGDDGDEMQVVFGVFRIELDGKANDGQCDQTPCSTSSEGDNVKGIGLVRGGSGGDLLIGSGKGETFRPGDGPDVVQAKGGDDLIQLFASDGADDILCGGGADTVIGDQPEDSLTDCES